MIATKIAKFLDLLTEEIPPPTSKVGHHIGSKDGNLMVYIATDKGWHSMILDNEDLDLDPAQLVGDIRALMEIPDGD